MRDWEPQTPDCLEYWLLTNRVSPIRNNSWSRDRSIDSQNNPINSVWGSRPILNVKPVLSRNPGIRHFVVVVGGDIIVAPTRPIAGAIGASFTKSSKDAR